MQTTKKEVEDCLTELREALLESIEAGKAEDNAKQRKIKAHYRLSKAKETLRAIGF